MTDAKKPTIYLGNGPDNSVSISAYPFDHEEYESNHWDVLDHYMPHKMSQDTLMGCLRNVLSQSGVTVIME
jgi:hypothetical protein